MCVRVNVCAARTAAGHAARVAASATTEYCAATQVSQTGLKLEEVKTKKVLGCVRGVSCGAWRAVRPHARVLLAVCAQRDGDGFRH